MCPEEVKKKILIIDDDPVIVGILQRAFTKESGFELETAISPEEAMRRVLEIRPDLVILDLFLPEMSGLEILKKIKEEPSIKNTPAIVYSSEKESSLVKKIESFAGTTFVQKGSVSLKDFINMVKNTVLV